MTSNGIILPVSNLSVPDDPRQLPSAIVTQMLTLATSGLGLTAALAWNEAVKATIDEFVKPYLPGGSRVVSLFVYATIITALAVTVTLHLAKLQQRFEEKSGKSV